MASVTIKIKAIHSFKKTANTIIKQQEAQCKIQYNRNYNFKKTKIQ